MHMNKNIILLCLLATALCDEEEIHKDLTSAQAWGYGMLAGLGLIVLSLVAGQILMCVKHHITLKAFMYILNLLYALAAGTMVGDVILHALPQAFAHPDTKTTFIGLAFMLAILFFILMERSFKLCGLTHQRWGTIEEPQHHIHEHGGHAAAANNGGPLGHGGLGVPAPASEKNQEPMTLGDHWQSFVVPHKTLREQLRKIRAKQAAQKQRKAAAQDSSSKEIPNSQKQLILPISSQLLAQAGIQEQPNEQKTHKIPKVLQEKPSKQNIEAPQSQSNKAIRNNMEAIRAYTTYQRKSQLKRNTQRLQQFRKREENQQAQQAKTWLDRLKNKGSEGYLCIFTSFVHNFFDGFYLGAGFGSRSSNQFISILVAVYCQSIPRELGDIAILMKNGFDDCQTKVWVAVPKIFIVIGVAVGLALETTGDAARYYILSFVSGTFIYMASDIWKNLFQSKQFKRNFFEVFVLIFGVGIEYLLLLNETH